MFRSEAQRAQACAVLTMWVPGGPYFLTKGPEVGPTPAARKVARGRAPMSTYEIEMVRLALDIYNGRGKSNFGRWVSGLDNEKLRMVGELLCAMSKSSHGLAQSAVDEWLLRWYRHYAPPSAENVL